MKKVVACDIGGSHITVGAVDSVWKQVTLTSRAVVDSKSSAEKILGVWRKSIAAMLHITEADSLFFAMPGPFEYGTGVSRIQNRGKYESLYGMDLKAHFSLRLGLPPENIHFRNDAACFVHGEVLAQGIAAERRVLGITLGTGLGAAFSTGGLTTDMNYGADPYRQSIADQYFSTRGLLKAYAEKTGEHAKGVAEICQTDSVEAKLVFAEYGAALGVFLAERAALSGAEVLLIGGNIAKARRHFEETLIGKLSGVEVIWASQGEHSALLGAALIR